MLQQQQAQKQYQQQQQLNSAMLAAAIASRNNQQNLICESRIKPKSSILDNFPNLNNNHLQNYNQNATNKGLFLTQSKNFPYMEEKYSSKKNSLHKNFIQDRDRIYLTKTIQKNKNLSEEFTKFNQNIKNESIPITLSFTKHSNNISKSNLNKYDFKNEGGNINFNIPFSEKKISKFNSDVTKLPDDNLRLLRSFSSNRIVHNFKNQISMNDYLIKNYNIGSQEVKNTNSK